jgi:DNA-binding transcriptional regulator YhcF (GntR family)
MKLLSVAPCSASRSTAATPSTSTSRWRPSCGARSPTARRGERLPPARDLAAVLGVNTNTVLRALRTLRDEGILEFRRGRGVTVAGTPDRTAVVARVRELVEFARTHGYRRDELVQLIDELA